MIGVEAAVTLTQRSIQRRVLTTTLTKATSRTGDAITGTYAYRFVHCGLEGVAATRDQVVRHRCHNRLCLNPEHLELGSQTDNKRDDWEFAAGGVDFDLL